MACPVKCRAYFSGVANKKMIRTQIQVQAEQMKWLKKHALEKGISMSQAIRDSIDFYRVYIGRSRELYSKKKNALKAVGSFSTEASRARGRKPEV
jgi:hypothetical protein